MAKKKTKTWNLGENAKGGVITVEVDGLTVSIIGKQWDFAAGSGRKSNQSNAKEFTREMIEADSREAYRRASDFLGDLTTSYYADEIIKWIESIVTLDKTGTFLQ